LPAWQIPLSRSIRVLTPRDQSEVLRPVRALAFARAFLALFSLGAIYLDPTEPTRFAALAYASMILYVVYSLAAMGIVTTRNRIPFWLPVLFQFVDLLWAAGMTLLTEGPNSPFYLFFLFVLLAAAYRWGLRETILTTVVLALMLLVQGYAVWSSAVEGVHIELNRLIMRSSYMMLMGFMVGFLAEAEKQARVEASVSNRLLRRIKGEAGVRGAMQVVFQTLLSLFGARRVVLLLDEPGKDRHYVWEARPLADSDDCLVRFEELQKPQPAVSEFPRAPAWQAVETDGRHQILELGAQGRRWRESGKVATLPQAWPFQSAMGVAVSFGREWSGLLLLLDPHFGKARPRELHFLASLLQQAAPILYNVYLYRRLRSQASAVERARVARELHDGVIQSLISLELQLRALRSATPPDAEGLSTELENIQQQLHHEVLAVRELMEQMKPVPLGPRELLHYLADRVDRFRNDSGISARFVTDIEEASLSPRVARELVRILQEGLVNIRKHSGARSAVVHFHSRNGHWVLGIEDDGKGMPFAGRRTLAELDAARGGPVIIKERVRAIGGDLTVESEPGGGCRLEITVAQRPNG